MEGTTIELKSLSISDRRRRRCYHHHVCGVFCWFGLKNDHDFCCLFNI